MGARDAVKAATGRLSVGRASARAGAWASERARALMDILPPYRVADGILDRKEKGEDGEFRIVINGARISVDATTFQLLQPGERLKARYTARMKRAISITRYVGGVGREKRE